MEGSLAFGSARRARAMPQLPGGSNPHGSEIRYLTVVRGLPK